MLHLDLETALEAPHRHFALNSYEGGEVRWCPGCGDTGILTTVQRICRDAQIPPEKIVSVSGIGCSSRFPHYMHTYGFHGLHGRALPVACGVKARRPDLTVWVATGDGDCCSIGAGHWLHAARYNMDLTVMIFDNAIYGLTKKQTSPTTPVGISTNTHPEGAWLPPLNILQNTLGFTNISFVAQTVDWNPLHLHATLEAAYKHRGTSFVHILQRCPTYTADIFSACQTNPDSILLLAHDNGIPADDTLRRLFKSQHVHDPADISGARDLAGLEEREGKVPIGLLYHNPAAPTYEGFTERGLNMAPEAKLEAMEAELDQFAV